MLASADTCIEDGYWDAVGKFLDDVFAPFASVDVATRESPAAICETGSSEPEKSTSVFLRTPATGTLRVYVPDTSAQ